MAHYSRVNSQPWGPGDAFAVAASAAKARDSCSYYPQIAYTLDLGSLASGPKTVTEDPPMGTERDVHILHLEGENDEVHVVDRVDMSWAQDQGVVMQGRYQACRWNAHIAATGSSTSIQDWKAQAPLGGRCATLSRNNSGLSAWN
ncbi:hypothetical protein N7451_002025 [Penicillium sp. IBT 35674x]|nr:hypothetical protein N7451_002025 [Penicillium sp. IBT 35674x]